ncbi:hypothetical protein BH688_08885 [Kushneria phosphatilytica]|uniref:Uncharacterized protein n=1 Tax=Kushneria phosphatilytica TaxID=657387 RepID=A0A1S1NQC5_9GAMM|nr:hypothetical protein BH688_08885 [Kushneria phosphatilytica]QEL12873.1 hypothetical protein FY550_12785 [Kushneria phosphatilytica]
MALLLQIPVTLASEPSSVVIITNPDVELASLNHETARAIFAMRQRAFPNGQSAHVFVLPDNNAIHERFAKEILNVYPHQLRLAWDRVVFSGTGQAPNEVSSEAAMVDRVASTPGGIGYVDRSALSDRVRVLTVE